MTGMNREKEIWAMALWVEKNLGHEGWFYIAQRQDQLLAQGEDQGAKLWAEVGEKFDQITNERIGSSKVN